MGNHFGGKKNTTKVMKINGETFKLKTPVKTEEILKDHPGHVLLESESVKHYGIKAKPMRFHQNLEPKKLYFLVVLPDSPVVRTTMRARSVVNMSAKDKLDSLMLARRSNSDILVGKPMGIMEDGAGEEEISGGGGGGCGGGRVRRVKMRLTKTELEIIMRESRDEREAGEKIKKLWISKANNNNGGCNGDDEDGNLLKKLTYCNGGGGRHGNRVANMGGFKAPELMLLELKLPLLFAEKGNQRST